MNAAPSTAAIAHRFDAIALEQLRAEVVRQAEEIEQLRAELYQAQDYAAFWWREATDLQLSFCEHGGGRPGLTIDGHLVVVPGEAA